ncbi:MAG: hypothetical protein FJ044_00520 [Candidatus Cloacimonetes bacterium]|nr:hypothetical protein [Candidatus Cloacimonadota bacterium]
MKRYFSFFDWECPPRRLRKDEDGSYWFDFDLDLEQIVEGKKLDKFTELPKLVTRENKTEVILDLIEKEFGQKQFLKLVADTNWLYLYPESLKRTGGNRLCEIAKRFENLLQGKADQIYGQGRIKVLNFTRLQGKFKTEYEGAFNEVLSNYETEVPKRLRSQWEMRLISHVGLNEEQKQERRNLTKRVIASYAAEGIVFDWLDKSGVLPNPVWISFIEPPFAGETTEILRKRRGLPPLPKIFLT